MRTLNFSIFISFILLLFEMKECMEDKGKGIEGESSRHRHGGRGGRGSRRSRGGRIQHVSTEQIQSDQGNKQC